MTYSSNKFKLTHIKMCKDWYKICHLKALCIKDITELKKIKPSIE